MDFKLSKKNENGKWWSWGSVKTNQYGNNQASFKVTEQFKKLVNDTPTDTWLNFALFKNTEKKVDAHNTAKANAYQPQNDLEQTIPF